MNLSALFDLSPAEKLQLVEDLWDDLAARPGDVPVHEWQLKEVLKRREEHQSNSQQTLSWEELKKQIRDRDDS